MERTSKIVNTTLGLGIVSVVKTYDAGVAGLEATKGAFGSIKKGLNRLEEVGAKYRQQNNKKEEPISFRDNVYVKTTTVIAGLHCKDVATEQKKRRVLAAIADKYSDTKVNDVQFSNYCLSILNVPKTR